MFFLLSSPLPVLERVPSAVFSWCALQKSVSTSDGECWIAYVFFHCVVRFEREEVTKVEGVFLGNFSRLEVFLVE